MGMIWILTAQDISSLDTSNDVLKILTNIISLHTPLWNNGFFSLQRYENRLAQNLLYSLNMSIYDNKEEYMSRKKGGYVIPISYRNSMFENIIFTI